MSSIFGFSMGDTFGEAFGEQVGGAQVDPSLIVCFPTTWDCSEAGVPILSTVGECIQEVSYGGV